MDYVFEEAEETFSGTTSEGDKLYPAYIIHTSPLSFYFDSTKPLTSNGRTRCLMLSLAQLNDDVYLESIRSADIGVEISSAPSCSLAYPFFMGVEDIIRYGRSDTAVVFGGRANLVTSFLGRDHVIENAVDSKVAQAAHRHFGIDVIPYENRRLHDEGVEGSENPFPFSSIRAFAEFVPFFKESGILGPLNAASEIPWSDYVFTCHTVIFDDNIVIKECLHISKSDLDLELTVELPPFMSSSNHLRYNVDDKSLSLSVAVSNVMQADLFYMSDPDTNTLMFRSAIEYEETLHFAFAFNGTLLLTGDTQIVEGGFLWTM